MSRNQNIFHLVLLIIAFIYISDASPKKTKILNTNYEAYDDDSEETWTTTPPTWTTTPTPRTTTRTTKPKKWTTTGTARTTTPTPRTTRTTTPKKWTTTAPETWSKLLEL